MRCRGWRKVRRRRAGFGLASGWDICE